MMNKTRLQLANRESRRAGYILLAALLTWLLATAWLPARLFSVADANVSSARTRAHTWTFATDEFQQSASGYLSPVARAPFAFTAAAIHLKPGGTADLFLNVELRLRADGGDWSPWYVVDELEHQADGRLYGDNLVVWPQARQAQVRIHSSGPLSGAIHDVTLVAIDAHAGPTTEQAASRSLAFQSYPGLPHPTVISRAGWGADEDWMTWDPEYAPVDKVILHHTVSGGDADPAAEVRAIYYYHAVTRGWGDIGYNFLVDKFGNIYEGRYGGPDVIGAHVSYWNEGSVGVSVLGCYDNAACVSPRYPTAATLDTLADLSAWAASRHGIDPRALRDFDNGYGVVSNYVLAGHRDFGSTVCPGDNLYAELPNLRLVAWEQLPDYDVRFDWHDTPSSLGAGQQVNVHPNLYNHGRLEWSDDAGARLGYRWLQDEQVVAENTSAARIIPGAVVNFGEMTALVAQLTAPLTPGVYTLRWDLYRDGVGWFADQPAPSGRSQPLDVTVEVEQVVALDMQLSPPFLAAGDSLWVNIVLEGVAGQSFETHTSLPPEVQCVVGSGQADSGSFTYETGAVIWTGTMDAETAQATFELIVSPDYNIPSALSIATMLTAAGYSPIVVERWLIVNGYYNYLPLVGRAWAD